MNDYRIYVTAKQGIFNPAGATSAKALAQLGYQGIHEVRVGKYIELTTSSDVDEETVREMCEKLLANPIIEDFCIQKNGQDAQGHSSQQDVQEQQGKHGLQDARSQQANQGQQPRQDDRGQQ